MSNAAEVKVLAEKVRFGCYPYLLSNGRSRTGQIGDLVEILDVRAARIAGRFFDICDDCKGTGYRPGYEHVDSGRCWPCRYTGLGRELGESVDDVAKRFKRRAADRARRARKAAEAAAQEAAKLQAWREANAGLVAAAEAVRAQEEPRNAFEYEIAGKILTGKGTEKQIAAFLRVYAEENEAAEAAEAARAAAQPVPESGRHQVTGTVVSVKDQVNVIGKTVWKVLVEDDRGFRVWGTLPEAIWEATRGTRVTFVAELSRSGKDELFGFFKRPTKAAYVKE